MSHTNNKEVESWEKEFDEVLETVDSPENYYLKVKAFLHQELQKAQESWLREEIVKLEVIKKEHHHDWCKQTAPLNLASCGCWKDWNWSLQTIIDRYQSDLDQLTTKTKTE